MAFFLLQRDRGIGIHMSYAKNVLTVEKCWICLLFTHIVCAECEWLALLKQPSDIIYSDVCWIYKWAIMHVFKAIKEVKMHSVKKASKQNQHKHLKNKKLNRKHTQYSKNSHSKRRFAGLYMQTSHQYDKHYVYAWLSAVLKCAIISSVYFHKNGG